MVTDFVDYTLTANSVLIENPSAITAAASVVDDDVTNECKRWHGDVQCRVMEWIIRLAVVESGKWGHLL
ncbi:MAG: hypothetical protein R2788_26945 [Saprospiraceae bacterium]